ncbi:beta-alanine-activating enzyme isoform X2 [Kryptolebias marmoratus]|uniref:beta-alanine-activating enzyme isoform X2 n=1 Tax=Kryptolebias marmoratus TaxID=37003 RepID=UPI0018ACD49F|nr:beta-alanine-activating enzyme isoform X2 [Kryptolebias marmoratus]
MPARTLQELVSAAASLHPDRKAVVFDSGSGGSEGSASLLYRDLAQLAEKLSRVLLKNCSPSSGVIGLYCSDDLLVPVWILGILQSGAAYAPLDPEAPGFLSARVMSRCGLQFCAVKSDLVQHFQASLIRYASVEVCVELPDFNLTLMRTEPVLISEGDPGLSGPPGRRNWAYVLHTSGTTGPPRTVRVPHECILPNILHLRSLFQITADDVLFLASPLTFDPSVVDIFLALSSGAQLLTVPAMMKKKPSRLAQLLLRDHRTTVLQVTPTLLMSFGHRVLSQDVLSSDSSLRVLALGGEACPPPALLSSWRHEDNKTCIYNIYGITEVSCWACCYGIPGTLLRPSTLAPSSVPLGNALTDTVLEVRDERGCVITEGEGQVFIGGQDRVCLLDGEDAAVPGTMRASGDWVSIKDEQLYYLGRRDRMIKRNGKRVNLDSLQQLILSLPRVEACAVGLCDGSRLLAFVVAPTTGHQVATSTVSSAQQDLPGCPAEDLKRLILNELSLLLPSHCVPDLLVLVPALCLTAHGENPETTLYRPTLKGKVDMEALIRIYRRQRDSRRSLQDDRNLKQTLQDLWRETLGLPEDSKIDEQSNFLSSGGDSLKALCLCEDIRAAVATSSESLLEVLLDGTFSDVLRHLTGWMSPGDGSSSETKKRPAEPLPPPSAVREKKGRRSAEAPQQEDEKEERHAVKVVRRGGEVVDMRNTDGTDEPRGQNTSGGVSLSLSWSSDTGRCVDASPVILIQDGADGANGAGASVFIGSHSHRVQAVDLLTGNLLWERVLGDRIEASAAVSRCGTLVVVGCYDGYVYFLCAKTGATRWSFQTGDAVKSCPAVDPFSGLVAVGSHDGHVYALNPQIQQCVWKRHCGGGAVFSSPHLHAPRRRLYVASLGGRLLCLDLDSGDVLWSYCRGAPFFSSPNSCRGHVVIGSVDGHVCCLSDSGELLWQFLTKGPVFSSPSFVAEQQRLLCGSHDGRLYCLNCSDGSLVWTFQTGGKVYATPCAFDGAAVGRAGSLAAVASTDGTVWILDAQDGHAVASYTLPGELFSSPVVWKRFLIIGCRNDNLYCLNLNVKE